MIRFAKGLLKSLVTTLIFLAVSEAGLRGAYAARSAFVTKVPLPYALGDGYGPTPPWLDRLSILQSDDTLIWRSASHVRRTYVDIFSPIRTENDRLAVLRRFVPTLPAELRDNPTWTIDLNAFGDRSPEIVTTKAPSIVRIACIGDSWTFGMNVDQDRTYPARLAAWLQQRQPVTRFEVLNFGVLGYSSFQGLQLLKTRVLDLQPDIVAIGFAMNDSEVAGYRDKDMVSAVRPSARRRFQEFAKDSAQGLEVYKLLHYTALQLKFHPKPIGEYLKAENAHASSKGGETVDYESIEPWTRVSPHDYEQNIREMIDRATGRGARVVLLDNELWGESPYRPILRRISADKRVPLVDSVKLVTDAGVQMARDLETRLALTTTGGRRPDSEVRRPGPFGPGAEAGPNGLALQNSTVIFRVYRGAYPVTTAMSIAGNDPQLGDLAPNAVLMHDDGTAGDQRAGDGVWSLTASFAAGTRLSFVYTNSGARGHWEGLDVPHIRHLVVAPSIDGQPVYLPIDTFGRIYMQADDWHTDATGYDLIGRAVADAIVAQTQQR
jgi:lysophospholipase L1-like esterase